MCLEPQTDLPRAITILHGQLATGYCPRLHCEGHRGPSDVTNCPLCTTPSEVDAGPVKCYSAQDIILHVMCDCEMLESARRTFIPAVDFVSLGQVLVGAGIWNFIGRLLCVLSESVSWRLCFAASRRSWIPDDAVCEDVWLCLNEYMWIYIYIFPETTTPLREAAVWRPFILGWKKKKNIIIASLEEDLDCPK